jgi:hypothetical protein
MANPAKKPEPTVDPVISVTKCDMCDKAADFKVSNPSARDQNVCKAHLPWIYNINFLPENVSALNSANQIYASALKEKASRSEGGYRVDESGENSDQASTSGTEQGDSPKGTFPAGDTGGN